ncbi:MAG: carbohydrate kinase family protein [Christensenellales bacterium]|jgi:fructokinase
MSDFITIGELLIDFTPSGEADGQKLFMQNAGGAVANVAAAIAGFGISASFLGMVGNDVFGRYLAAVLQERGVDTSGLAMSDKYSTTLAFVHLSKNGERDFSFYRKPGADIMYSQDHLDIGAIKNARVFHFGSLSLTDEPARSATFKALDIAKESGVVISYDPNYRKPLWKSEQEAKKYITKGIAYADILKISDNEASLLFRDIGHEDIAKALVQKGVKLVFITLGSKGAIYANVSGTGIVKAFKANAVDTTGAGDCFTAAVLYRFIQSRKNLANLTLQDIGEFARFATAAASVCVERMGGIPSMPDIAQVMQRLNRG